MRTQLEAEMQEIRRKAEMERGQERKELDENSEKWARERGEMRAEIERLQEELKRKSEKIRKRKEEEREIERNSCTEPPTPKKYDQHLATSRLSQENTELKHALNRSSLHHQLQLQQLQSDLQHHQYITSQLQTQLHSKDLELTAMHRATPPIERSCASPIECRLSLSSTTRTTEWKNSTVRSVGKWRSRGDSKEQTKVELERVMQDLRESQVQPRESETQLKQEIKELAARLMQVRMAEKEAGSALRSQSALRQTRPHSPAYRLVD